MNDVIFITKKDFIYTDKQYTAHFYKAGSEVKLPIEYFEWWKKEFKASWDCNAEASKRHFGSWDKHWGKILQGRIDEFMSTMSALDKST